MSNALNAFQMYQNKKFSKSYNLFSLESSRSLRGCREGQGPSLS